MVCGVIDKNFKYYIDIYVSSNNALKQARKGVLLKHSIIMTVGSLKSSSLNYYSLCVHRFLKEHIQTLTPNFSAWDLTRSLVRMRQALYH